MSYRRTYNPDRFTRRSLRMSTHDYTAGAYFITIRTYQSESLLEVPELRTILLEAWQALPGRFPGVTLDEFVIMPDHMHFILWRTQARNVLAFSGSAIIMNTSCKASCNWSSDANTSAITQPNDIKPASCKTRLKASPADTCDTASVVATLAVARPHPRARW